MTKSTGSASTDIYGCIVDPRQGWETSWLWGKDLFPEEAYKTGFTDAAYLDDPLAVSAFQATQDLTQTWKYSPPFGDYSSYAAKRFGMVLPTEDGITWWRIDELPERWGKATLPYGAPGRRSILWTDPWIMSSRSDHPDQVWEFIKYLVSPEVQSERMKIVHSMPSRMSLIDD